MRVVKVALAIIYKGIREEMLLSLAVKKTAKKECDALATMCQGAERVKEARIQMFKADFESLNMKENGLIDDFCVKMNNKISSNHINHREVNMTVEEAVASLNAHKERVKGKLNQVETNCFALSRSSINELVEVR